MFFGIVGSWQFPVFAVVFSFPIIVWLSKVESIWFVYCFQDESILIWFSGKEEKRLKLTNVSRIISGQRTVSFLTWLGNHWYYFAVSDLANNVIPYINKSFMYALLWSHNLFLVDIYKWVILNLFQYIITVYGNFLILFPFRRYDFISILTPLY